MDEFIVRLAESSSSKRSCVFELHKDDSIIWNTAKLKREHDNQPWQIKVGSGRNSKRYKATKRGGVAENASYYVFYKNPIKSNTFEAYPIDEWYSVTATARYKPLTSEEAEKKFEERNKMLNFFSVMHSRNRGDNSEEGGMTQESKKFKISELDDYADSDCSFSGSDEGENERKKKASKKTKKIKDDPENTLEEAGEETDEGDLEHCEVDYMSDTSSDSSSDSDVKDESDVKGIAEEDALRALLNSDDEEEENLAQSKLELNDDHESNSAPGSKLDGDAQSSGLSSDDDDSDLDGDSSMQSNDAFSSKSLFNEPKVKEEVRQHERDSANPSSSTATASKPKISQRQVRLPSSADQSFSNQDRYLEGLIRKYLSRKPMTLKNLLKSIKPKITDFDKKEHMFKIAVIIKRICDKQNINDNVYYTIKT